jgi:branched-subunit amino acid transport protein
MATMTEVWIVIAALGVVNMMLKGAGPWMLAEREVSARAQARLMDVVPALLAALVVVGTVIHDGSVDVDARSAGVVAAAGAIRCRAPLVVVLVAAAATTALVRSAAVG